MGKNIDKYISKSLSTKYRQKCLDHANNLPQLHLKLFITKQFKKKQKKLVLWLEKSQENHHRINREELKGKVKQKI